MPQGYPIENLYQECSPAEATAAGYPDWHFGETGRRYLSDGTIQFTNTTKQTVPYTATIESGTNHEIEANSAAKWPSNWNTTAKTDIGLTLSNGWIEGKPSGPSSLRLAIPSAWNTAPWKRLHFHVRGLQGWHLYQYPGCKCHPWYRSGRALCLGNRNPRRRHR